MEKPVAQGYHPQQFPTLSPDEKPAQIKRKPVAVPVPAPTHAPSKNVSVETHEEYAHDAREYKKTALPPRNGLAYRNTLISRLRRSWTTLRKRTRILIMVAVISVLALIIGLAAGLPVSRVSNLLLPRDHGGPYSGVLTYYDPALGACGMTNNAGDAIAAVSHVIFDAVKVGTNPNANPLCGKKIRATKGGKSIDLTVVDRCTGCQPKDIDVTRSVFKDLANIDEGRVPVEWSWLEDVPRGASAI